MASIYALKGRFQDRLRPAVRIMARGGIAANQITLLAAVVSLAVAWTVWRHAPAAPALYALLPLWMLLRMALNAVDGMLAREFGQKSALGAYLNELCDVIADVALYLSLLSVPGMRPWLLLLMAGLAALTEFAGALGPLAGASRRYDGPMGKSDRAFVFGLLGLLLAIRWLSTAWLDGVVALVAALCALTVWKRVRAGVAEARAGGAA